MQLIEGVYEGAGRRFALVASRFNEFITSRLVKGAGDCLCRHGVSDDDITVVWVPVHSRFRSPPAGSPSRAGSTPWCVWAR